DTCAVSGVHQERLVVILRNAGYRINAGRLAEEAFGEFGTAGGHKSMARAEIPLAAIKKICKDAAEESLSRFVMRRLAKAAGPQKNTSAKK
ncbi:MAG: hypothetical protein ABIK12_12070, partial [Pseudomonadota bacterium]